MKIDVNDLTKTYHNHQALDEVSFTLDGPKIYGLLGRNGAGKTTFMDILAGQILETGGTIEVNGEAPFDNDACTQKMCLIKEGDNFKKEMKIKHVLKMYSIFYPDWDPGLADELMQAYQLDENARIKALSKGMESALGIIVGLSSKAPITIFDESYIGLDAAARKMFYDKLLEEYEKEKRMVIFSTHLIDEVSTLFEEILILQNGSLVLQSETDVLRERAHAVSGPKSKVLEFISDRDVIRTKELAGMMTAYIFGPADEAEKAGLQVEGIPIQDLMVYLTQDRQEDL